MVPYFSGNQTGNSNSGQSAQGINPQIAISPLLLDPSLTEVERKAIEAWQKELRTQCSAVSDLFVGQ